MQIILNLEKYQYDVLFSYVNNTLDIIKIFFTSLEYLFQWSGNRKERAPYLLVEINDNCKRMYLVGVDKIISFCFELNIDIQNDNLYDKNNQINNFYLTKYKIDPCVISIAKQYLNNYIKNKLLCESILDEETDYNSTSVLIFEHLLSFEWGYVRYDCDPSHEKKGIHPANHLDINYSKIATYKLGIDRKIKLSDMKQIFDKSVTRPTLKLN